jgi:HAD superfamily hydrolase (TIGR01484 family)
MNGHDLTVSPDMVLFLDVDLTLLPGMSRNVSNQQRGILNSLFNKTSGGVVFVTGRSMESLQECFPGMNAMSVEHHAAYTLPATKDVFGPHNLVQHVNPLDTAAVIADLHNAFRNDFALVDPTARATGPSLVLESKQYSIAVVHNNTINDAHVAHVRDTLQAVWEKYGLQDTHAVKVGFDAVEISVAGRDKALAVRDFMTHAAYQDRKPVFVGDSMADAIGMKVAYNEFNGQGIAVGDKGIPDAPYVHFRLDGISDTWNYLADLDRRLPDPKRSIVVTGLQDRVREKTAPAFIASPA